MQYDESAGRPKDTAVTVTPNVPSASTYGEPVQIKIETVTRVVPADEGASAADVVSPAAVGDTGIEGPHEKTMTEKVKEILIDTAHVAKEKTLGALHVAYEKLHDAGVVVEDKAAQVLKNMGHAQQLKAEELEKDAAQKRIEVAEEDKLKELNRDVAAPVAAHASSTTFNEDVDRPKSPGILTKAYHKIHDAGIAVEDKAAQFFKNMGHSNQTTAAELESDANARRLEAAAKPEEKGIVDKAKDLGIAAEEKVANTLKDMGQSNKETAGGLYQDAGERRLDSLEKDKEPSLLDKAKDKIQSATASIEDSAAKALHELSDKSKDKADDLKLDAAQKQRRRSPSPGRISPQVLDSFGAVSANVEEKAARMRESMGVYDVEPHSFGLGSSGSASGGSGKKSIEIDVDSVLGGHSFGSSHQPYLTPPSVDYSSATRLPKEVPPPEERKVVPDPVD